MKDSSAELSKPQRKLTIPCAEERYQGTRADFEGRKNTLTLDHHYRFLTQPLTVKCIVIYSICKQILG